MRPPLRPPVDPDTPADPGVTPNVEPSSAAAEAPATDLFDIIDPIPPVETVDNPFGLSPRELVFVEAYVGAAQFRAAKAYEMAGYKPGSSARANGSRMLTRERVSAAIAALLHARVKAIRIMDGDEALEGISNMARADIRKLFPPDSRIAKLDDATADAVKSITPTKHGYRIEMYDKLQARLAIAKGDGRLKETIRHEHTLEEIMAAANRPAADDEASA